MDLPANVLPRPLTSSPFISSLATPGPTVATKHCKEHIMNARARTPSWNISAMLRLIAALVVSMVAIVVVPGQAAGNTSTIPEQKSVLLLTESTFMAAVHTYQPLLVLFDSPGRQGSLALFKSFADAATALRITHRQIAPRMRLAAVDITQHSVLLDELNVLGVPALLRFNCPPGSVFVHVANSSNSSASDSASGSTSTKTSSSSSSGGASSTSSSTSNNSTSDGRTGEGSASDGSTSDDSTSDSSSASTSKSRSASDDSSGWGDVTEAPVTETPQPTFEIIDLGDGRDFGQTPAPSTTPPIVVKCSFENNTISAYTGGRTSIEIQRFMLDLPPKDVMFVANASALSKLVTTEPFVVLCVVDGLDTQAYFDCINLAQSDNDIGVYSATVNLALLPAEADPTVIPALILYRDFGRSRVVFGGSWSDDKFAYIQRNRYAAVSTYANAYSTYYYDEHAVAHVMLFSDSDAAYHADLVAALAAMAPSYNPRPDGSHLRFVYVPKNEMVLRNAHFVSDDQLPTILVIQDPTQRPVRFAQFAKQLVNTLEQGLFENAVSHFLNRTLPADMIFQPASLDQPSDLFEPADSPDVTTLLYIAQSQAIVTLDASGKPIPWKDPRTIVSKRVQTLTAADLVPRVLQRSRSVVLLLSSDRCFLCREFGSVYEELANIVSSGVGSWKPQSAPYFYKVDQDAVNVTVLGLSYSVLPAIFYFPPPNDPTPPTLYPRDKYELEKVFAFLDNLEPLLAAA